MFRSRTRPVNACTGKGKHKNNEIKNLFKESLLKPDCKIKPIVGDGDKPGDKKKPKKYRVIPLYKTIHIVSAAEIHAHKERQRIKREIMYTPKESPPPVVKETHRIAPKKYQIVRGLNAIKEIKVEKKVPHWEVFPSVVKHEVQSSDEDFSDTEIEELEKLILPLYPFQCNFPPLKKSEDTVGTSSKIKEEANEKSEGGAISTNDKTEIEEEVGEMKQKEKEEEKEVASTEIKDEPQETCEKEEKKYKPNKTPKINAPKRKAKKKEKLSSSNEEKTKVEFADRVLTRTAKSKLLKSVNIKEEKEPQVIQNTGRITRSKTKDLTVKKKVEPKIDEKNEKKKKKEKATVKGKVPAKVKTPTKGKIPADNGVARGRSVKKKIKINFHDKKNLKHFKDFSLAIETE